MKKLRKIILIDDDELDCFIAKKVLRRAEVAEEVQSFTSSTEGLKHIIKSYSREATEQETYPVLIFLDINMPVIDGFQVVEKLQLQDDIDKGRLHIFMLTSSLNSIDINKITSFSTLVKGYLVKPLDVDLVKEVLASIPQSSTKQRRKTKKLNKRESNNGELL